MYIILCIYSYYIAVLLIYISPHYTSTFLFFQKIYEENSRIQNYVIYMKITAICILVQYVYFIFDLSFCILYHCIYWKLDNFISWFFPSIAACWNLWKKVQIISWNHNFCLWTQRKNIKTKSYYCIIPQRKLTMTKKPLELFFTLAATYRILWKNRKFCWDLKKKFCRRRRQRWKWSKDWEGHIEVGSQYFTRLAFFGLHKERRRPLRP